MTDEVQTCPRRIYEWGGWDRGENLDTWTTGRGLSSQSDRLSCSFCGSLHPNLFMAWLNQGGEIGPTDKNYKAYIRPPSGQGQAKFYYRHLSQEQCQEFVDMINEKRMNIGIPGYFYVLPFFCVVS